MTLNPLNPDGPPTPEQPARIDLQVPPEMANGVFADFVGVWHNPYGFTLDFGVFGMTGPAGDGTTVHPATVVSRVKVPPGLIFQIAQAIAENVDRYETSFGPITPRPSEANPGDFLPDIPEG